MVGRDAAQVAADERHRRAALALPVQVQEIGHDQPEGLQVPVQRRAEPGGAQHHVTQPLDLGRAAGLPLGGVDPHRLRAEVQRQRGAPGQRGELRDAVHHPHREPARITEQDGVAAPVRGDRPAGTACQPVQVVPVGRGEGRSDETGLRAAPDHQARGAFLPTAQQQRLRRPVGHGEAEVGAEPLRAVQVRLLELQPGQPGHLDQGIPGPPRVLSGQRAGLAVQRPVRVFPGSLGRRHSGRVQMRGHDRFPTLDYKSSDHSCHLSSVMIKLLSSTGRADPKPRVPRAAEARDYPPPGCQGPSSLTARRARR